MKTISYELKTLSSLIISPRSALAFYKDLDQFSLQDIDEDQDYLIRDKVKVIYPFYQYGMYETYEPATAKYYLPGSSIKGALCQGTVAAGNLMVDDVLVPNDCIALRNIHKAQHLEDKIQARFEKFFNHIGVEMIRGDVTLEGRFNHDNLKSVKDLLKSANEATRSKIEQMKAYLKELIEKEYSDEELSGTLRNAFDQLCTLAEDEQVALLGGYKGLLHSMEMKGSLEDTASAIYLDPETKLPHGLVKIDLVNPKV